MYAYPECSLSFFKTPSSSVVEIPEYIQAAAEDSLCIHSATKAAIRLVGGSGTTEQFPARERQAGFGQ